MDDTGELSTGFKAAESDNAGVQSPFLYVVVLGREAIVPCHSCQSENQKHFPSEMNIHIPQNLERSVFAFPKLLVCLDCGTTEFRLEEILLRMLTEGPPAQG